MRLNEAANLRADVGLPHCRCELPEAFQKEFGTKKHHGKSNDLRASRSYKDFRFINIKAGDSKLLGCGFLECDRKSLSSRLD